MNDQVSWYRLLLDPMEASFDRKEITVEEMLTCIAHLLHLTKYDIWWTTILSRNRTQHLLNEPGTDALFPMFVEVHGEQRFLELLETVCRAHDFADLPEPLRRAAAEMQEEYNIILQRGFRHWGVFPPGLWRKTLQHIDDAIRANRRD